MRKMTMLKPVHTLVVRDWKEDVVQLVQFPRTHTIISPSPFALKLETFLRMNNIKYHNVSNDFTKASAKGQSPFIELNGRQFPDSGMCIEQLHSHFKLPIDNHLSANERAQLRAFNMLIEESLFRCLQCDRSKDYGWLASDKGYAPLLTSMQKFFFQKLLIKQLQSRLKKTCVGQGYGRHTQEEIDDIAKKDLMAISTFLGEKPFFFGDNPTTLDATLFGHLTSTPNLVAYVQRMKERYWPDWAQILEHLALNPEDLEKSKEEAAATVAGENGAKVADQPQQVTTVVTEVTTTAPASEGMTVQAQG
uniref:Failed axon connections protein n=1 Tax=Globodera rostochiensis TaxID=31243 RepID=A0A914HFN0_GLORO